MLAKESDKQLVIYVKASGKQILSKRVEMIANLYVPYTDRTCLALIMIKKIGRQHSEC